MENLVVDRQHLDLWRNKILDIIFLSYDEPNADKNYAALKARFPHARRVHNVKGIANAHIAAAKKAMTNYFYVVDADASINSSFDFSFKPGPGEEDFVHLWYAFNPAIGQAYGYGGVKLFNKKMFKAVKTQLDFTTTLTKDIKIHEEVACTTNFNSDPIRAFRGAFREAAKLQKTVLAGNHLSREADNRLHSWLNPTDYCHYREYVVAGALAGYTAANKFDDLLFINDHEYMTKLVNGIDATYRDVDTFYTIPTPMQKEFFFTTRIASALYDPSVLNSLPITELRDAISDGQLFSKVWLVEKLQALIDDGTIAKNQYFTAVLGGWIGTLSLMMNTHQLPLVVTSVDLDERANNVARKLNHDFLGFSALKADMNQIDYSKFDIVINTSSEHIPSIEEWRSKIPAGKVVIVQNNNFIDGEGHISCVESDEELKMKLNLSEVYYQGTKHLPIYDRYMVIGRT